MIKIPFKNKEQQKLYAKEYRKNHLPEKRAWWKKLRLIVLSHYSKGKLDCACCGEKTYEFLSIDHINGGGTKHRKDLKSKYIYSWLKTHNFPSGFQVLCHNCNMAKAFYKICPHQKKEKDFPFLKGAFKGIKGEKKDDLEG